MDTDAIGALYAEIEKAGGKGLIPKGGSLKLVNRLGSGARGRRLMTYILRRTANIEGRVKRVSKSVVEGLDAEIEKALRINGGVKVSSAQRRNIAMQRGAQRERWGSGRKGKSAYRGDAWSSGRARGYMTDKRSSPKERQYWRDAAKVRINAFRARRGEPAPYKRTLFGGLKRIRKASDDISKAKPKTLYVYRPVENAEDIIAWAESQGFTSTQPGEKLHVTLAYSKTPLNWAMLHDDYHLEPSDYARSCGDCVPVLRSDDNSKRRKISGGVREVKALGKDGAIVLAFESDSLTQRWMDFKRAGAVWKFPSFTPHVTITYDGKGVDLSKVHPYAGDIILGEECWEEVDAEGQAKAIAAEKVTKAGLDDLNTRLAAIEAKQAAPKEAA